MEDYSSKFANIGSLPRDVLALLFFYLREYEDLKSVGLTCKRHYEVIKESDLLRYAKNPPARLVDLRHLGEEWKRRLQLWREEKKKRKELIEVKVAVEGVSGSGKTALILRFHCSHFVEEYNPFTGNHFRKQFVMDGATIVLQSEEQYGGDEFPEMQDLWRRECQVTLMLYSTAQRDSFDAVADKAAAIRAANLAHGQPQKAIILVGCQIDREEQRKVTREEGRRLAERLNLGFAETSSKTGEMVEDVFHDACRLAISRRYTDAEVNRLIEQRKNGKKCVLQ